MVLNVELAARILTLCSETRQSVTEVLRGVGGSHDNTIDQIRELKNRSLLHVEAARLEQSDDRGNTSTRHRSENSS